MDGNSVKGKSGVGTETGTESDVLSCISPSSERIVALHGLFGLCTFLSIFMLPICGGLYSLCMPLSSK